MVVNSYFICEKSNDMRQQILLSITEDELKAIIDKSVRNCLSWLDEDKARDEYFDLDGLCDYLPQGLAKPTIYNWLQRGKIPGYKKGKKWYFLKNEIDEWLAAGKVQSRKNLIDEVDEALNTN